MEYKDLMGQEIKIGDYIAYGVRSGNTGSLHLGKVLELTSYKIRYNQEELPSIKIVPYLYGDRGKICTLTVLKRVVSLSTDTVPQAIKEELK